MAPFPRPGSRRLLFAVAVVLAAAPAAVFGDSLRPALSVREDTRYYRVDALKAQPLRLQIDARRPARHDGVRSHALTEAVLTARYDLLEVPEGCRLGTPSVVLELTTWLPDWQPPRKAAAALYADWAAMLQGLRDHERGHRDLAVHAADRLADALQALPSDRDCAQLRQLANRALNRVLIHLQLRNDSYDRRTQHGRLQGAML